MSGTDLSFSHAQNVSVSVPEASLQAELGQLFCCAVDSVAIAQNVEAPTYLIVNPSSSGKIIKINEIQFSGSLHFTQNVIQFRLYIDPTVTSNGTILTPVGMRQNGQNTVVSQHYSSPAVSSMGSMFNSVVIGTDIAYKVIDSHFSIWIEPGHSMLITTQVTFASYESAVSISFSEE